MPDPMIVQQAGVERKELEVVGLLPTRFDGAELPSRRLGDQELPLD